MAPQEPGQGARSIIDLVRRALLDQFAPPSVLVDRKYCVRFLHGNTDRYLKLPSGEPTNELTLLAREPLRAPIRHIVGEAAETGQAASVTVLLKENEPNCAVTVTAQLLRRRATDEELFLVSFQEKGAAALEQGVGDHKADIAASGGEIEEELRSTRDELRSSIKDLEASNQELKASNEEVTSMNEELQSTNEELETSKEELQSLNEELSSVNNQLYAKLDELERRGDDLRNLLSSTDIATIFLDSEYRIRWFTPPATTLFHINRLDVNRPIGNFAQHFHDDALLSDAQKVLQTLTSSEKEVESNDGRHYLRRILPYRTEDNRFGGIVITFVDITEQKEALQATEEARRYAENIVETIGYPLIVLDRDLRVRSANAGFYEAFGLTPDHVVGRALDQVSAGEWDIPELRQALAQHDNAARDLLSDIEVERAFSGIGTRVLSLNARRIQRTGFILLAIADLTERKKAEESERLLLMELEHRVKNILQNVHALLRDARNRSRTVPELYEALATRIDALARTQEMLANCGQRHIDIRSLISQEAMAHAAEVGQNLFLEGPPLQLMPRAAQVLAMAVHELATNAFKFGALSKAGGRVSVSWRMETPAEAPIIDFRWKETGLSMTGERPPTGFGTEFIVKGLPFMLGGTARLEFEPDGVLCVVTFPVKGNVYWGQA